MTETLQEWLEERAVGVPAELVERVRAVIDSLGDTVALDQSVRALSHAVAQHLQQAHPLKGKERRDAPALLTTDALVTYVLELAAAVAPEKLDVCATDLMHLIVGPETARPLPPS